MQGVVFLGDRKLELRNFPDPTPGPREVVIEIKASGMCGSDLHVYRASFKPGDTQSGFKRGAEPVIAGHEPCVVRSSASNHDIASAWSAELHARK
jgi:D-arabinose 1-dehydrogenase-like Zn-dependent alcohol dehydrogenase